MFKVNNEDTRTTPLASLTVNFEHVNAGWDRPISLLTIHAKIFKYLIYNKISEYFIKNDLISRVLNLKIYIFNQLFSIT